MINKTNTLFFGSPGTGKTLFLRNYLQNLDKNRISSI